jgi:hypothetical protein
MKEKRSPLMGSSVEMGGDDRGSEWWNDGVVEEEKSRIGQAR